MRRAVSGSNDNGIGIYDFHKLVGNAVCFRWSLSGISHLWNK